MAEIYKVYTNWIHGQVITDVYKLGNPEERILHQSYATTNQAIANVRRRLKIPKGNADIWHFEMIGGTWHNRGMI